MSFISVFCFVLLGGLFALLVVMLRRNNATYKYRMALAERVYEANKATTQAAFSGTDWREKMGPSHKLGQARWEWLNSVTYDEMALRFWKPLDSFYGPMPCEEEWPEEIDA